MKNLLVAFVLSALLLGPVAAQVQLDLDKLEEKFSRHLETKMPGWKHERIAPIAKGENVLIEFWSFSNRKVKVAIIPRKSAIEAREAVQGFMKYEREREELKGFGDEAYGWGYGRSNVIFRKGRFTVYISTTAEVDYEPETRSLSQAEKGEREKSEKKRLSREFAKHMVSAIDLP